MTYFSKFCLAIESLDNNDAYISNNQARYYLNEMFKQIIVNTDSFVYADPNKLIEKANHFLCEGNKGVLSFYSGFDISKVGGIINKITGHDDQIFYTIYSTFNESDFLGLLATIDKYHSKYDLNLAKEDLENIETFYKPTIEELYNK